MEARVESARRASEIHKRRTGRSLKVTEQDVINEEMYEEEDDDLPMQYRRLTAHLQTNSADFNRRLNAYLTNQVAMRSALGQGIINAYAQDFQHNPQFASAQPYFPSPMLAHQQQQQMMQQSMQPPMQPSSPSMQRQAPYPSPRPQQQGFQPQHGRSASIAAPQQATGSAQNSPVIASNTERRASMPIVKTEGVKTESLDGNSTPLSSPSTTSNQRPSFPQGAFSQQNPYNQIPQNNYNMPPFGSGFNAFSMQLPQESQQMLYGSGMLPNDPLSAMMMQGSNNLPLPAYSFNPTMQDTTEIGKGEQMYPTVNGLNSTLAVAPSDLEMSKNYGGSQEFSQNQSFFDEAINPLSDEANPAGTPGLGGEAWSNFIDTDRWDAPTSSQ